MRILLWSDMEGMSQITDHRECWPVFPHYWQTGRRKFTADVVAAASGLLEGGATEVVAVNGHGLDWQNLLEEELPKRTIPFEASAGKNRYDALFQVGFHARCGTADGFISHTFVPNFRLAVNGDLVTESHAVAWRVGIPLLGVVGDAALGAQIDGLLSGTPFLPVKRSISRTETPPLYANAEASSDAVRNFAARCAREFRRRKSHVLASPFTIAISVNSEAASMVAGQRGLVRSSPGVLTLKAKDWNRDAEPAIGLAMGAALRLLITALGDLDLSSEAAMRQQMPAELEQARQYFVDWMRANDPAWKE